MHRGRLLTLLLVNSSPIEKHWKLHFTRPYERGWEASAVLSTANSLTLVCRKFHICHELAMLKSVVNRRFWEITTSGLFGLWKREYPCQNLWTEASVSDTPLAMTGPSPWLARPMFVNKFWQGYSLVHPHTTLTALFFGIRRLRTRWETWWTND